MFKYNKYFVSSSLKLLNFFVALNIFVYSIAQFVIIPVKAASIPTVAVGLTPTTASVTTTAVLTFTAVTAITTGTILEVTYDTGFTGGAALTDADITVTGTNITGSTETLMAAGYFKSTIAASSTVTTGTVVTITVGGTNKLTNPVAGNYGWGVTADIGAAGTTFDYGAGLAYVALENVVNVKALVPAIIDLELYQAGVDTLLVNTSPQNRCNLGLLALNIVKTCLYDVAFGTNNGTGLTVKAVRNGALTDGSAHNITDVADGAVTAGSQEYGFRVTDAGTGCGATAQSTYASSDMAVPASATSIVSSNTICNGTASGQTAARFEITHKAAMDGSTYVGSYTQTVTWTAFTN
ncbi:MAG: hypothetical protein WCJ58_04440 [bacterium]